MLKFRHSWFLIIIGVFLIFAAVACSLQASPPAQHPNQNIAAAEEAGEIVQPDDNSDSANPTLQPDNLISPDVEELSGGISILEPIEFDLQTAVSMTGFPRQYTPEELKERLNFVFTPSFDYRLQVNTPAFDPANLLPPNKTTCDPVRFTSDLIDANGQIGQDNVPENYSMVSFLECNGVNYVTPVKDQVGGTCGTYTKVGAMEIMLGLTYPEERAGVVTNDHPINDFSPVNLSEGYDLYTLATAFSIDGQPEITGQGYNDLWQGATLDAFYPDPEFYPTWWDWNEARVAGLSNHYETISECQDLVAPAPAYWETLGKGYNREWEDDLYRQLPVVNCLMKAAKQNQYVFYSPSNGWKIKTDSCVNISTGEQKPCSELSTYGNVGDTYQVDYELVDTQIKNVLNSGYPVRMAFPWLWDYGFIVETDNTHYEFEVFKPKPASDYTYKNDEGFRVNEKRNGHWVIIIGYLQGDDGQDFWIIKNSWGNRDTVSGEDTFGLLQTASTSGDIQADNSTKRNLYLGNSNCTPGCLAANVEYYFDLGVDFTRLNPSVNTNYDALNTKDESGTFAKQDLDQDGVRDIFDNCPINRNPGQEDQDGDFVGDECDRPCETYYDRYQNLSNPNLPLNDYNNDGVADVCVPSPYAPPGLTIFAENGQSFGPGGAPWAVGSSIGGGWHFSGEDKVAGVGDFNGDGKDEFILRSNWGITLIGFDPFLEPDFLRVGSGMANKDEHDSGWNIHKKDFILGALDYDGDGEDEILVKDADGLGMGFINLRGDNLTVKKFYGAGFANWTFDINDTFEGIGDFNRDGKEDFILKNADGLGIITSENGTNHAASILVPIGFSSAISANSSWTWISGGVHAVGDFNGDGSTDFILQDSINRFGILSVMRNQVILRKTFAGIGASANGFPLDTNTEEIIAVGDFNRDGKDDLVIRNSHGIVILGYNQDNTILQNLGSASFGDRMGSWLLGRDDQILLVGSLDGGGGDDFLIKSPWGFGIISLRGSQLASSYLYPYGELLSGNWLLREDQEFVAVGNFFGSGPDGVVVVP